MCRTGFMGVVNRYCTHYVLYKSDFSMCLHYCLQTFIEIWTIFTPHLLFFPSHLLLILKLFSHQDYYSIALFINFATFFPSHLLFHRISYSIVESRVIGLLCTTSVMNPVRMKNASSRWNICYVTWSRYAVIVTFYFGDEMALLLIIWLKASLIVILDFG